MASIEDKVSCNLQCPVCLEILSDPRQLSCTHTICKKCLNDILKSSSQNSLPCPICQWKTDVGNDNVLSRNKNVPLKSVIDDMRNSQQLCEMCDSSSKALHFCFECGKNMCDTCLEHHNNWRPNLKHRVVSVEDIREGKVVQKKKVFCQEHKSDGQEHICTDVCITCKKLICLRCRLLSHENKGHKVQNTEEYNASIKTDIESLQALGKTKAATIKDHVTCIESQRKRVNDHIDLTKAEITKIHEDSIKKLKERKAALDKQLEAQRVKFGERLDEMKNVDEMLVTGIESASVLASNRLKAQSEDYIIAIRDSLSGELKNVQDRDEPEKKLASDVADRAEQLIFTPNNQTDQLKIGEVGFVKCELECDVELSKKDSMNCIAATPDGRMAVGYSAGGIDIFSADGQLQQTALNDICISGLGFLYYGRCVTCVILATNNCVSLYSSDYDKLEMKFETLSHDKGGYGNLAVDSYDLIYVGYRKAKKIQVFSSLGGKAVREIPCNGYGPEQITACNDLLIIRYIRTVRIVDKEGNVRYKMEKSNMYPHAVATQRNSILIAWVKHDKGLVSIEKYNNELNHVKTLITDQKIEKPDRKWYCLQEFRSGELTLCTPNRLYIFN